MSQHGQSGFLRRSRDWEAGLGEACSHVGAIISKISVPGDYCTRYQSRRPQYCFCPPGGCVPVTRTSDENYRLLSVLKLDKFPKSLWSLVDYCWWPLHSFRLKRTLRNGYTDRSENRNIGCCSLKELRLLTVN